MNRPRFRTDLVTSPKSENGNRFVDVTDPDSGQTFRFYEVEYAVATAMDGKRDVNALIDWAREELGLQPSPAEVETVVSTLDALGYLRASEGDGAPASAPKGADLDISDLSLGAPGKSPIRADERRRREASNIDLGSAGRSPRATPRDELPRPDAADVELGAAGAADDPLEPMTGAPPAPPPLEMPQMPHMSEPPEPPQTFGEGAMDPKRTLMGTGALSLDALEPPSRPPSNLPRGADLSVDLGQHINIGTDDVKEAVRASRVMSVPEVPSDFGAPPPRRPNEPVPGSRPIELHGRPPGPSGATASLPPPPFASSSKGPGVMTIILFVVLLAAVAGAVYYFFIYAPDDEEVETTTTPIAKTDGTKIAPMPVGMVTKGETKSESVTAPQAGKLGWLIAADAVVAEDEPVAKLVGFKDVEDKIAAAEESKKRYQTKLDRATASGNKAGMQAAEADVSRKQGQIDELQAELDAFVVTAPSAGIVEVKAEEGQAVEEGAELVAIKSETWPTAEFTITDPSKYKVGEKLEAVVKSDPSKTAMCEITEATATQLRIKCPPESGLAENAALTLR